MTSFRRVSEFVSDHAQMATTSPIAYSVLFENYDKTPNLHGRVDMECFLFTDRPDVAPNLWRVVYVDQVQFGPRRTARYFKCLGHLLFPGSRLNIYFDASFDVLMPLTDFIDPYQESKFALFRHSEHGDVETEGAACKRQGKEQAEVIDTQVRRYRVAGLPEPSGCYATGVLVRDFGSPAVAAINEMWCREIISGSIRDQISLPYVLWRQGIEPDIIEGDVFFNNYLVPRPHSAAPLKEQLKRYIALQLFRLGLLRH